MMPSGKIESAMLVLGLAGLLATAGFHVGRHRAASEPTFKAVVHEQALDRNIHQINGVAVQEPTSSAGSLRVTVDSGGSSVSGVGMPDGTFIIDNGGSSVSSGIVTQPSGPTEISCKWNRDPNDRVVFHGAHPSRSGLKYELCDVKDGTIGEEVWWCWPNSTEVCTTRRL